MATKPCLAICITQKFNEYLLMAGLPPLEEDFDTVCEMVEKVISSHEPL